eukprot:5752245-Pyramimonas_sp.AAC.1
MIDKSPPDPLLTPPKRGFVVMVIGCGQCSWEPWIRPWLSTYISAWGPRRGIVAPESQVAEAIIGFSADSLEKDFHLQINLNAVRALARDA